jgi:hypothetical protein
LSDGALREADLRDSDLEGATLVRTDLVDADLAATTLRRADLTDADLRGGTLAGSDLRGSVLRNVEVSQGTRCGRQTRAERAAVGAEAWDQIARAYNTLKSAFSEGGLVGKARKHHVLERRARGYEAKANGAISGSLQFAEGKRVPSFSREHGNVGADAAYIGSWLSRVTTGFGVRPFRLTLWMLFLFAISAVCYEVDPGISDSIYYSVVTFTTAPPPESEPTLQVVRAVALVETFGGTLLIVLLGYILGNRERF